MKSYMKLYFLTAIIFIIGACSSPSKKVSPFISDNVNLAAEQTRPLVDSVDKILLETGVIPSPRTADGNKTIYTSLSDWTSGFFPGTLWYLYELTQDEQWKESAIKYTEGMEDNKYYRGNHDIGFMINCSFGNGYRLTGKGNYPDVIVTAAQTLSERYRPEAGVIQSWPKRRGWECPVIVDNMMNLELLFEATQFSGDQTYWDIAVSHADKTMANHYRQDMSCYHVVDYDPETGEVLQRQTHQGLADESAWARGQAWGLYGYTMCYRYTKDPKYLDWAEKIADYWFSHHNMTEDLVPYWDFDDPQIPNVPRDASAAAITASAMYELSLYAESDKSKAYKELADKTLEALGSPAYRAKKGENGNFILMHSTGALPLNNEIDVPLVYADYYFMEALKRKRDIEDLNL